MTSVGMGDASMLRSIAEGLWLAEGPVVRFMRLFPYPTRMAVVRLHAGGLWVWSPIVNSPRPSMTT